VDEVASVAVEPRRSTTRITSALLGVLGTVFLLALCSCGGRGAKPSSERLSVRPTGSVAGTPQGYLEYLPPGYGDDAKRPLLVFLHGAGDNGGGSRESLERMFDSAIPQLIRNDEWPAARPFIVLMPQHVDPAGPAGGSCPDGNEIAAFLEFAMERYDVDPTRVYLTGLSCGAIGIWNYLALDTDRVVAAAVPIAGYGSTALSYAGCDLGKVAIWAFHGSADEVIDAREGTIVPMHELETCDDPEPSDVRTTIYPGVGHDSWTRTYDLSAGHDVYAWLLSHQNA
jgi:predicted peptidase